MRPDFVSAESVYTDSQSDALVVGSGGWWSEVRNKIIGNEIARSKATSCLWDIGSDPGITSEFLQSPGVSGVVIEPSLPGAFSASRRGVPTILSDSNSLNLPSDSVNAIALFDVIEHIDNRLGLLLRALRPAMDDANQGHVVKYNRRSLGRELAPLGFDVIRSTNCFVFLVIPIMLIRSTRYRLGYKSLKSDRKLAASSGAFFGKILGAIERAVVNFVLIGTSLIVTRRKSNN